MNELINKLNEKIVINDLIIRKMKYEINMLFYDSPSNHKANILAKKIHAQIDNALEGVNEEDKESIRKLLILNSFMVIPNPVSDHINYGHVFTTLTNFDDDLNHTKERLVTWLDKNTEFVYEEESLNQYIKTYKIKSSDETIKTAATTFEPSYPKGSLSDVKRPPQAAIDDVIYRYKLKPRAFIIPLVTLVIILSFMFINDHMYEPNPYEIHDIQAETYDDTLELTVYDALADSRKIDIKIIPDIYKYQPMNLKAIYEYLEGKESKLIEDDYLSIINEYAEANHINPLLFIAIIGHEQAFVPVDHDYADQIINNPYNVYGSWIDYNTDFEDATNICTNTINTAIKNRPSDMDLIEFLNNKYAEDKTWHQGVSTIYKTLLQIK